MSDLTDDHSDPSESSRLSGDVSRRRLLQSATVVGGVVAAGGFVTAQQDDESGTDTPAPTTTASGGEQSTASITFDDHGTMGESLDVASATLPDGGFVVLHDSNLSDGDAVGSVIGVSEYVEAGTHEDLTVYLDEPPYDAIGTVEMITAMAHRDTNGDQDFDFVETGGAVDGPYADDDGPVTDQGRVDLSPHGLLDRNYRADLDGEATDAAGTASFEYRAGGEIPYELTVSDVCTVTQAHVHLGEKGEDGPIVAWLYPEESTEPQPTAGSFSGTLAEGVVYRDDRLNAWSSATFSDIVETFEADGAYVDVHTETYPDGEIRGQITRVSAR